MANRELVLAGDIGGTKTHLAVFSTRGGQLHSEMSATFASKNHSGLLSVLKEFLAGQSWSIEAACFGIAGPVIGDRVKTPNLPWVIEAKELRHALKLESVHLLNDLEAAAYGIFTLADDEFCALNSGARQPSGNKALIAAGTGLGESILYDDGSHFRPLASEGGHADYAPRNDLEIELLRYLIDRFGHVSYERVVSGPGLFSIYQFFKERRGLEEPKSLSEKFAASDDPSAVVSMAALANEAEICVQSLDLFVSVYGAEAGNLALRAKALGGFYIGGGIAPKILSKLTDGTFMRAFVDKGRYRDFVRAIPVQVILNDRAALRGAAYYAACIAQ